MATAYLCPITYIFQLFSDQGIVGAGYKINTYVAGSTTPVATYTDSTLTVPNANPIIAQSNGRLANEVWVPGGTIIKAVITDASGSPISGGTFDNLAAINDASNIAQSLNPQTAAEIAAGVTPTNYSYPFGDLRRYGAKGDETTDDTAAINSANAAVAAKPNGGTVFWPSGRYKTTSTINVPAGVSWNAEEPGWYNTAVSMSGVLICPQHINDAVYIGVTNGGMGQYFNGIGIRGYGAVYSGGSGNGFNVGPCANITFEECNVFHVYGNSFVIGDGSGNANTNKITNCYSNNPQTGSNFVINSTLFRGDAMRSDGGVYGLNLMAASTEFSIGRVHFEGFTSNAITCATHQGHFYGHNIIASTYANTLTAITHTGTANGIFYSGFDIQYASAGAGSVGFDLSVGANITIRDCTINAVNRGVQDTSATNGTVVDSCIFNNCVTGIYTTQNFSRYVNNYFVGSTTTDIEHAGGSGGLWCGNHMSLTGDAAFRPTNTGQSGNFGTNAVRDNAGYKTRNSGFASSIATASTINHGLAVAPTANGAMVAVTPSVAASGITSPISVSTFTSTTFRVDWTGTTPNSFYWEARLLCDF